MKVLASDYDGTLKVNDQLSDKDIETIKKWQKGGNWFGVVTGRSPVTIKEEMKLWQLEPDFLICNNGGVILNRNYEVLEISRIPDDTAASLLDYIETTASSEVVVNNGVQRAKKQVGKDDVAALEVEKIKQAGGIAQIVVWFSTQDKVKEVADYINKEYSAVVEAFMNIKCIDIVPKGCNKGVGLEKIAEIYDIPLNSIYTIGDAFNDLPMLKIFTSATLEHAVDEIKAEVETVVPNVASFLEKL
ncbi:MAG: HAD family hydrolase [Anaerorhabdus sp.]